MLGARAGLGADRIAAPPTLIRLPDAAGLTALPRCAGRHRGRRGRELPALTLDDLALARGRKAASSRSRPRRSIASCRRWSTSSSSAASISRRAAIPGRRSSRAASTAARPSGAPSCSTATSLRRSRTGRVHRRPAPAKPAGTVANAAPHPEQPGGSALIELRLAALGGGELRLGRGVAGARLRQRAAALPGAARGRVDALIALCAVAVRELFVWYRVRDDRIAEAAPRCRSDAGRARASRWPGLHARS